MASTWIWSAEYKNHYYVSYDSAGQAVYNWAKQQSSAANLPTPQRNRVDSGSASGQSYSNGLNQSVAPSSNVTQQAQPAESVPESVRQSEPNFIGGTPEQGWYDTLDRSYRMRTGAEAREFFRLGRVFSMLYTEAASATAVVTPDDEAFTIVRLGGTAHTQIRRFVVVSVRRNFVHACAISTYRNQGTYKRGCDPSEHALVYNSGINPEACYFAGERERGLIKEPIEVAAAATDTYLTKESRIRFGKIFSIEWNVKVKDIGLVVNDDLGTLIEHHNYENQKWDTAA